MAAASLIFNIRPLFGALSIYIFLFNFYIWGLFISTYSFYALKLAISYIFKPYFEYYENGHKFVESQLILWRDKWGDVFRSPFFVPCSRFRFTDEESCPFW